MKMRYIREISKALAEKHAAVMVGAGFSKNADKVNITEDEFLTWNQMSDMFYENLYGDSKYPGKEYYSSLRLAQEVEITLGRPALETIIRKAVPDQDYAPSDLHISLMELPWNDVFTTNYDSLLERAAEMVVNRRYNIVTCQEDLVNSNDAPRIIKLHGSFPAQRPFIITEEDYRTYPIHFAAMVNTVQQALLENVFCMLGFACEDPNFIEWIGWIHDHLGKSSAQKIYMVSVSHVEDAKQKMYFSRNIVVIDLEEIWPEKTIRDRLRAFFEQIKKDVYDREQERIWGNLENITLKNTDSILEKTKKLCELRKSYPGWIFIPWEIKNRIRRMMDYEIIHVFDKQEQFLEASKFEQVEIMFEYLKLHDIVGRPILSHVAELFRKSLQKANHIEQNNPILKKDNNKSDSKVQYIWLQLYRTYRELAKWELVNQCRNNIQIDELGYDEQQFLYAEECKYHMIRFQHAKLMNNLEKWKMASSDIYWPLIKAYFYVNIGEKLKAEALLMDDLKAVRRQLTKKSDDAYLSSIEESVVSLLNFIRQDESKTELEKCVHDGKLSWWDENNNYCMRLQQPDKKQPYYSEQYHFNLMKSYSLHLGQDNSGSMIALEYWRFLEQTGHPFRIGMVTCKTGLEGSVERLCRYYPYWSVVQILTSREDKHLDKLYGRLQLACMTVDEIDGEATDFLEILSLVNCQVGGGYGLYPRTIYDQVAGVLPKLIARLCSKCSVKILDQIFKILVEINLSGKLKSFSKTNELFRELLNAYTVEQQMEKLLQILSFPIKQDRMIGYIDPINYVTRPREKVSLSRESYAKSLQEIRYIFNSDDAEEKEDALNRLAILQQIIVMEKEDEDFLIDKLKEKGDLKSCYIIYAIKKNRSKNYLKEIVQRTFNIMQSDGEKGVYVSRRSDYAELIYVLKDIHFADYNLENLFRIMTNVLSACEEWNHQEETNERTRECCMIAQGIIISLYKDKNIYLTKEMHGELENFITVAGHIYPQDGSLILAENCLMEETPMCKKELRSKFWLSDDKELNLLCDFLRQLVSNKISIKKNTNLKDSLTEIANIMVYRFMQIEIPYAEQILKTLSVLYRLVDFNDNNLYLIDMKLEILLSETVVSQADTEETAIWKIRTRIIACEFAYELSKKGYKSNIIAAWKKVSLDSNEFAEIRKVGNDAKTG